MVLPRLRILFSEDHPDTREMTCILLEREGIDVVCPDSSYDVVKLAQNERFDAFLLDTWTPGLSGVEVCQRIREFDSHTPIIFYSAAAFEGDKQKAFASGAQAYVSKPTAIDKLVHTIRLTIQEANNLNGGSR